jgi:hypothetical protein
MFKDYWKYHWVLAVHRYEGLKELLTSLSEKVLVPAEAKVRELEEKRKLIEEALSTQQSADKSYPILCLVRGGAREWGCSGPRMRACNMGSRHFPCRSAPEGVKRRYALSKLWV